MRNNKIELWYNDVEVYPEFDVGPENYQTHSVFVTEEEKEFIFNSWNNWQKARNIMSSAPQGKE